MKKKFIMSMVTLLLLSSPLLSNIFVFTNHKIDNNNLLVEMKTNEDSATEDLNTN